MVPPRYEDHSPPPTYSSLMSPTAPPETNTTYQNVGNEISRNSVVRNRANDDFYEDVSQIECRPETPSEQHVPDEPKIDNETSVNAEPEMLDESDACAQQEVPDVPGKTAMRNDGQIHKFHKNSVYVANGT